MRTEVFEDAVSTIKALGAERVLVLQGPQPLKLRAAYGMKEEVPWNEQVSLSILERSLASGECLLLGDARTSDGGDRWSLAVSEIRSVLCVPFWSPSSRIVGLLYADTLSRANVFTKKAMDTMLTVARNLERGRRPGKRAAKARGCRSVSRVRWRLRSLALHSSREDSAGPGRVTVSWTYQEQVREVTRELRLHRLGYQ